MQFTVYFKGGATSQVLFADDVKHPAGKKGSIVLLKQEYAHDMGGKLTPFEEEIPAEKNTKKEIKEAKNKWKGMMRALYPNFTPKLWARDQQLFPQPKLK